MSKGKKSEEKNAKSEKNLKITEKYTLWTIRMSNWEPPFGGRLKTRRLAKSGKKFHPPKIDKDNQLEQFRVSVDEEALKTPTQ